MPRISEFFGIAIYVYYRDHPPPHFHAVYGDEVVEIDIHSLGVLTGRIPPRQLGRVVEWAATHQAELLQVWEQARAGLPLSKIEPLA